MTTETTHVGIHGLGCPNCAAKVERSVTALAGVHDATVEFVEERAVFEYDAGVVSLGDVAQTVEQTGCDSKHFTITHEGERVHPTGGGEPSAERSDGAASTHQKQGQPPF